MLWSTLPISTNLPCLLSLASNCPWKWQICLFLPLTLTLWPWPWVKVTIQSMFWSVLTQSTIVSGFVTVVLRISLQRFKCYIFLSLTLTLGKGQHTKYALKLLANKYQPAMFGVLRFKMSLKMAKLFVFTFDLDLVTLTLGEGHHTTFVLNRNKMSLKFHSRLFSFGTKSWIRVNLNNLYFLAKRTYVRIAHSQFWKYMTHHRKMSPNLHCLPQLFKHST